MQLTINRKDKNTFHIQGDIKIELSTIEELLPLLESLSIELKEHKSHLEGMNNLYKESKPKVLIKRFLSVHETAEYLGISTHTIYNRISRATEYQFPIKPKRVGRRVLFDINDLNKYLESL